MKKLIFLIMVLSIIGCGDPVSEYGNITIRDGPIKIYFNKGKIDLNYVHCVARASRKSVIEELYIRLRKAKDILPESYYRSLYSAVTNNKVKVKILIKKSPFYGDPAYKIIFPLEEERKNKSLKNKKRFIIFMTKLKNRIKRCSHREINFYFMFMPTGDLRKINI